MASVNLIAPSILSCDFSRIGEEIKSVEKAGADWIHVDVMDGQFVDNITLGPPVVASLKKVASLPLDVHLMIVNPEKYVESFIKAGADILTIHVEATQNVGSTLNRIRELGAKPGITLRPQTDIQAIEPYLKLVDLALVMTVNPGFGGQSFMPEQVDKVNYLARWAKVHNPQLFIEVDGGINTETAKTCRQAGANVFVAGNFVFKNKDYGSAINSLRG
ncbi:MAG: ribulose-phosphate 3-epimerase [Oligoflexia bacterium]|nr:ribulose-phosphate 3-epimerase [Oligoflexia bacterium]